MMEIFTQLTGNLQWILFGASSIGVVVPLLALVAAVDLRRRWQRLPAATALEDVDHRLRLHEDSLERAAVELSEKQGEVARAEQAASEAQIWLDKVQEYRREIEDLEPMRIEAEQKRRELAEARDELELVRQELLDKRSELETAETGKRHAETARDEAQVDAEQAKSRLVGINDEIESALQKRDGLKGEVTRLEIDMERLREAQQAIKRDHEAIVKEVDDLRDQRNQLKAEIAGLEATKAQLEGFVITAEQAKGEQQEGSLEDLFHPPVCLTDESLDQACEEKSELDCLNNLHSHLKELGLNFPERTLFSFHTCMKIGSISPLTVLAGISGTGKSELPRRYAEGMGIHFLPMAVQPRWDSPQDLFGFFNYLEHRYVATDLARALIHLDIHNHPECAEPYRDRMLMVLLDEMNLARVEYYFSEFLSRLEFRRSVDPEDPSSRADAESTLDTGGSAGNKGIRLFVDKNILFVGTMNEDESTQTLSDKVVDRANVLRFSRPRHMADREPSTIGAPASGHLPRSTWDSWHRTIGDLDTNRANQVRKWIDVVNEALERLERPFGHRVNQAILSYAANYPTVDQGQNISVAFIDQLEQRILPKLRGVETHTNSEALGDILGLIEELGDEVLAKTVRDARQKPLFNWSGVNRDTAGP